MLGELLYKSLEKLHYKVYYAITSPQSESKLGKITSQVVYPVTKLIREQTQKTIFHAAYDYCAFNWTMMQLGE